MLFRDHECGPYRIYTGCMEGRLRDGYTAGVVIVQVRSAGAPREVFRDEAIFGGHRWPDPHEALEAARVRAVKEVPRLNQSRWDAMAA